MRWGRRVLCKFVSVLVCELFVVILFCSLFSVGLRVSVIEVLGGNVMGYC